MTASVSSAGSVSRYLSTKASKEQWGLWWPSSTPGTSKGVAPSRRAGLHDLVLAHEEKLRIPVDEAFDEPGAGDAVHAGLGTGHPLQGRPPSPRSCSRCAWMATRAAGSPSLTAGTSAH